MLVVSAVLTASLGNVCSILWRFWKFLKFVELHLFRAGGDRLEVAVHLIGGVGDDVGLGRGFLGVGSDLLFTAENSSLALATCCAFSDTAMIIFLKIFLHLIHRRGHNCPSSSLLVCSTSSPDKSPAAIASAWLRADDAACEIFRLKKMAI